MKLKKLDKLEVQYLIEVVDESIRDAEEVMDKHLLDNLPETVAEQVGVLDSQQERLLVLRGLQQKLKEMQ